MWYIRVKFGILFKCRTLYTTPPVFKNLYFNHRAASPRLPSWNILVKNFSSDATQIQGTRNCWKCGREIDINKEQFVCICGVLQAPDPNRSYFQVMGQGKEFDIDLKILSQTLKDLQKTLHPDKFGQKSKVCHTVIYFTLPH